MSRNNVLINLSLVFSLLFCMAFACNDGDEQGDAAQPKSGTTREAATDDDAGAEPQKRALQTGVGKMYGARDPRECPGMSQPKRGAPSPAQAAQLVVCTMEGESGTGEISLLENVRVTAIGKGYRPEPSTYSYPTTPDLDFPEYDIRGSYKKYFCSKESDIMENGGKNCFLSDHPNATGSCYKDTFGEWYCAMTDSNSKTTDYKAAPPK